MQSSISQNHNSQGTFAVIRVNHFNEISFTTHHHSKYTNTGFQIPKYMIPNTKYQVDGWDGHEDESKQKWTFLGSSNHRNKFVFYHRFSMNLKGKH